MTGLQQFHHNSGDKVIPSDPRYTDLTQKGFNRRFIAKPEYIRLVGSTAEVVEALQEAVTNKQRVVVRSGGHCLEGFVGDPAVQVIKNQIATASPQRGCFLDTACNAGWGDPKEEAHYYRVDDIHIFKLSLLPIPLFRLWINY